MPRVNSAVPETLDEIDEALAHANAVPLAKRGAGWHSWVDGLLDMRNDLTDIWAPAMETRLLTAPETR